MLNKTERDAIRGRADKATPGPLHACSSGIGFEICHGAPADCDDTCEQVNDDFRERFEEEDAQFFAHARTDVPALLDSLDELEAENAALRRLIDPDDPEQSLADLELWATELHDAHDKLSEVLKLEAENAALREDQQKAIALMQAAEKIGEFLLELPGEDADKILVLGSCCDLTVGKLRDLDRARIEYGKDKFPTLEQLEQAMRALDAARKGDPK